MLSMRSQKTNSSSLCQRCGILHYDTNIGEGSKQTSAWRRCPDWQNYYPGMIPPQGILISQCTSDGCMVGCLTFTFLPRSRPGLYSAYVLDWTNSAINPFSDIHKTHGRIAILLSLLWDQTWSVQTFFKFEWWTRSWSCFIYFSSLILLVHPGNGLIEVLADDDAS